MVDVPVIPVASRADFRRVLAGLADSGRAVQAAEHAAFGEMAKDLVVSLCAVFGDELDRKTLWSRIDSGLQAACAKVDDGDADRWVDLLLEHVRASAARAARFGLLRNLRASLTARDDAHRRAFVAWVASRRYAVLAHGRAAWQAWKEANAHAPQDNGGEGAGDE